MLINTDLSTDPAIVSQQRRRAETAAAQQPSSQAANSSAASQIDESLQRLTDVPAAEQDATWEIQDQQAASQAVGQARQGILCQPDMALAAQANQSSQNVLGLLQPAD
jgi:hypothetical protein